MQENLLQYLVDFVKVEYMLRCNPLGLADQTSQKVQHHTSTNVRHLEEFYLALAGVFRFTFYGDNQLQFGFDGRDESSRYQEEWETAYKKWVKEFCKHENFIRAVLELTVFYPEEYTPQMVGMRLSTFITKFFEVKIDPQKGILKKAMA